ncbi:MAG: M23 family metallopeptidase [Paracoccus sp. (in: a-proteobacteria)]|nr:M23 family metallopeptidase [Paracoccus sp. (in: a-proteobacteria)]
MSRITAKAVAALSLTAVLAGCQNFPAVQQDLAGLGGAAAGAAGGAANAARPSTATSMPGLGGFGAGAAGGNAGPAAGGGQQVVTDPFAGQGVAAPEVPGGTVRQATTAAPVTTPGTAASGAAPAAPATAPARTHVVTAGETGWSVARRYGIPVQDLARANGLDEAVTLRIGQTLNIPAGGILTSDASAPGQGTPTPTPPSAARPLPGEQTTPSSTPVARPKTPDLGATRTAASGSGRLSMPVAGAIVRTYAKGRNDGIDISAPAGTAVKAAGAGQVAAITRDTDGVPIVVIRHQGELMTVYAGMSDLSVQRGDQVSAGQRIGTAGTAGSIHFEVRQGFESMNPEDYL